MLANYHAYLICKYYRTSDLKVNLYGLKSLSNAANYVIKTKYYVI